jgi:PIN domain nuclease of toxin-antitoxin system
MILLDTCALIWIVNNDPVLPAALSAVQGAIRAGRLFVSSISAWEIGTLASRGQLKLEIPAELYVSRAFSSAGVQIAVLTPEIAVRSCCLPGSPSSDPADRMLIATAMVMGLKLMTRDHRILDYGAQGHLPVLAC